MQLATLLSVFMTKIVSGHSTDPKQQQMDSSVVTSRDTKIKAIYFVMKLEALARRQVTGLVGSLFENFQRVLQAREVFPS